MRLEAATVTLLQGSGRDEHEGFVSMNLKVGHAR